MLFSAVYLLDTVTDCNLAYQYIHQGKFLYFFLTILFILAPMVDEFISSVIVKLWGGKSYLSWTSIFTFVSLQIFVRSIRSLRYAYYSRVRFDKDLCIFYSELNRLRCVHFEGQPKDPRCEALLMQALSYRMSMLNEKFLFKWKMNEALNESAPQLLLQMGIVASGETLGYSNTIGMLVSQTTFAWSLHLYHHRMHYVGLENNFSPLHRVTDCLAHFLIVCGRFMAISCIAALSPMWFSIITFIYLGFRFIYLYYFSSERSIYRDVTMLFSYAMWPIHRLFITPYVLNIWRVDLYDDVIYHFETLVLALSWSFLLDGGHPLADYRWAITATILVFNFVLLPLVLKYNASRHEPTEECGDGPPFPSWISLRKELGAGKPVEERLGGMYKGD
ncbi:uncharacterized protein LOC124173030 [Ischnura elegans]|uniref:uncharacterized protein LOC124173030 n=1 Tax=Ischnura elegans TaxID=197161 RepID=UPI001ED88677|nr:uncharacterized protein LOC124173030 [Ischnura elegans]